MKNKKICLSLLLTTSMILCLTGCQKNITPTITLEEQLSTIEDTLATEVTTSPEEVTSEQASSTTPVTITINNEEQTYLDATQTTEVLSVKLQTPFITAPQTQASAKINEDFTNSKENILSMINGTSGELEGDLLYDLLSCARDDYELRLESNSDSLDYYNGFYYEQNFLVARADSNLLSLCYDQYSFTGGAHGSDLKNGLTYDMNTGNKITFDDLSDNPEDFKQECISQITTQAEAMEKKSPTFFEDYQNTIPDILTNDTFYFSNEGLNIISQEYMLAPYAAGNIVFLLPYESLKGYLKDCYLPLENTPEFIVTNDESQEDNTINFQDDVLTPMLDSFLTWNGLEYFYQDNTSFTSLNNDIAINLCAFAILYDVAYDSSTYDETTGSYLLPDNLLNEYALDYVGHDLDITSFTPSNQYPMLSKSDTGSIMIQVGDWGTLAPTYSIQSCEEANDGSITVKVSYSAKDYEENKDYDTLAEAIYTFIPDMDSKFGYVIKDFQFNQLASIQHLQ